MYIVFGIDKNGKTRGARFSARQLELALQATLKLKLEVFEAVSSEMRELAEKLPSVRCYGRGRRSLPVIGRDFYERLHAASGGLVRDQSS